MISHRLDPRIAAILAGAVALSAILYSISTSFVFAFSSAKAHSVPHAVVPVATTPENTHDSFRGIISWMTKDTISIVDQYGNTHTRQVTTLDRIIDNSTKEVLSTSDLHTQSHVRVDGGEIILMQ